MKQDNEKEEPSVDEILSSIKDVIASDKDESIDEDNASLDDNVFELTDIIEDIDDDDPKIIMIVYLTYLKAEINL